MVILSANQNFLNLLRVIKKLERDPLENVAIKNQLMAYKHEGFWQCMDTKRDKDYLEELWLKKKARWLE